MLWRRSAVVTQRGSAVVKPCGSAVVSAVVTQLVSAVVTQLMSAVLTQLKSAVVTPCGSAVVTPFGSAVVAQLGSAVVTQRGSAVVTQHRDGSPVATAGGALRSITASLSRRLDCDVASRLRWRDLWMSQNFKFYDGTSADSRRARLWRDSDQDHGGYATQGQWCSCQTGPTA